MLHASLIIVLFATLLSKANCQGLVTSPEEYVNILGGTDSRHDLSTGGVLPFVAVPWGFNNYAIQSDDSSAGGWWFHPSDSRFFGIRVTHQPSPWIGDYGQFLLNAASIPVEGSDKNNEQYQYSGYVPSEAVLKPYYLNIAPVTYSSPTEDTVIEFAPESHAGIMKVSFPTDNTEIRRIMINLNGGDDHSEIEYVDENLKEQSTESSSTTTMITGYSTANSGGVGVNFKHYFVAVLYGGDNENANINYDKGVADNNGAWVDFKNVPNHKITVKFATSFISIEQAKTNLRKEGLHQSLESMKTSAKEKWHKVLSKIMVSLDSQYYDKETKEESTSAEKIYTIFYSSLYRASLFPRKISEFDDEGKEIHYSPYIKEKDKVVQQGPLTTDSGFWDAWNTIYPRVI